MNLTQDLDIWTLIVNASIVVKVVLFLLLAVSFLSWMFIFQKWFAIRFTGDDSEINVVSPGGHKPEFVDWRWEPMQNLPDLVVPFKRPVYERVVQEFSRFAGK